MILRPATPSDAPAIATLIASFQPLLTNDPSGAGAEHFLASVSEEAERQYLESDRYRFIVTEAGAVLAGVVALRDSRHLLHLFVGARFPRQALRRLSAAPAAGSTRRWSAPPPASAHRCAARAQRA